MDERERKLLNVLAGEGVSNDAEMGEEWEATANGLAKLGFLRRDETTRKYAVTEDGRLAIAGALEVTLYTRPGCHLCEEAKADIAPLLRWARARLREVNVDQDASLRDRYGLDVPVIFLGSRKVVKHRVDPAQFRRQLEEAQRDAKRFRP